MVKEDEPQIKSGLKYEVLRKKGMSKERAARIANSSANHRRGDLNNVLEDSK